jgi:hypothetical protein
MSIVTYLIEYLGELDYESGDQMGSFDAKKPHRKSHAWAPLKGQCHHIFDLCFFLQTTSPGPSMQA